MKQIKSNYGTPILNTVKDMIISKGWNQKWLPNQLPYVKFLQRINWKP